MLTTLLALLATHSAAGASTDPKAGLAWANALFVPMSGFTQSRPPARISSYYTWGPDPLIPPEHLSSAWDVPYPFVPMLWGCTDVHIGPFLSALGRNFDGQPLTHDRAILGFNEPDLRAQARCSPQDAARVWREVLQPLKRQGYRVGSPSVTNGPEGREWLARWFEACQGDCDPDFMTVHWYDTDPGRFINYVTEFYQQYGRPIWVTEYAPTNFTFSAAGTLIGTQPSYESIRRFMDVTSAWMDGVDFVERYFWFGAMYEMQGVTDDATLFDPRGEDGRTGALNELGRRYAGINGSQPGGSGTQPSGRPRWEFGNAQRLECRWSWAWLVALVMFIF